MTLAELLHEVAHWAALAEARILGDADIPVSGITHDSRAVTPGTIFACLPGALHDGHDFAAGAVAAGAAALLVERPLGLGVPEIVVASSRAALGPLAAALWGNPSHDLQVIGITGTNGKTTIAHLLSAILAEAGRPAGVIGTLTGARTTPEAPDLQATLARFRDEGRRAVAMEVSSHALDLRRVDGTRFAVAVFTNLSRDHLDYHGDMAHYFQAKARLFEPEFCERAVLNLDDPYGRLLFDAATTPAEGYRLADATDVELSPGGTSFTWRGRRMSLAQAGRFNLSNALAAATAAAELGVTLDAIATGLAAAGPIDGRFELVDASQPFTVVVDYAHTPDGLEQALAACRELDPGHAVIVVFGCGGDRDVTKRPLMGEVAVAGADRVVLTSDNPRHEDPGAIINAVLAGIDDQSTLIVEPDRRHAIDLALRSAQPGDLVLIAGKGHEGTQIIGDEALPFDDRVIARELLAALGHKGGAA